MGLTNRQCCNCVWVINYSPFKIETRLIPFQLDVVRFRNLELCDNWTGLTSNQANNRRWFKLVQILQKVKQTRLYVSMRHRIKSIPNSSTRHFDHNRPQYKPAKSIPFLPNALVLLLFINNSHLNISFARNAGVVRGSRTSCSRTPKPRSKPRGSLRSWNVVAVNLHRHNRQN